jgi:hypothetical protein
MKISVLKDPRWGLIGFFLGIITMIPLIQAALEVREGEGVRALHIFSTEPTSANLRSYEKTLEDANWAARATRSPVQFATFRWMDHGGEKTLVGQDGWFFYRPGVNYTFARPEGIRTNDPLPAIVDFKKQLEARGIKLLLVPVPNKESIYPDRLSKRAVPAGGPLSPSTREVMKRLREAQVEVVDLFAEFSHARSKEQSVPLYLAQDTHWSPAGLELAAKAVSTRLLELGWANLGQIEYSEKPAQVSKLGDILRMMQVPAVEQHVRAEPINCHQVVRGSSKEPYKDSPEAEILLLGDSFSRIFQQDEPGSSGFIAHLAQELRQPLLSLVNDGGGSTMVRTELQERPAFLMKKKVVIWEFVERDLALGIHGWKLVPLPPAGS